MANIFVYENRLWKEKYVYTEPGIHPFSLNAGEYLLMCHGAKGGAVYNNYHNLGGVAYGVLNLNETKSMYAYVGGDGGDSGNTGFAIGTGGFNGGGNGGKANQDYQNNDNYKAGAGGGGASDIRLKKYSDFLDGHTPVLPQGYQRVEYIELDGTLYFDTGYIAKSNTTFTSSVSYVTAPSGPNSAYALLGSQYQDDTNPGWVVWLNSAYYNNTPCIGSIFGNDTWDNNTHMFPTGVPSNQQVTYRIDKYGTFVNNQVVSMETNITGEPQNDHSILFCATRITNDQNYNSNQPKSSSCMFAGKVYFFRIYELENDTLILKHQYIPAIRQSDGKVGLCDTISGSQHVFLEPMSYPGTANSPVAGPISDDMIESIVLEPRYYPTIDTDHYTQLQYLQSPGNIFFDSGYIANENSAFTFRIESKSPDLSANKAVFGAQSGNYGYPGWACWYFYYNQPSFSLASFYGDMQLDWGKFYPTYVSYSYPRSASLRVEKSRTFTGTYQLMNYTPGGTPNPNDTIKILTCSGISDPSYDTTFIGLLYHFRIYEKDGDDYILKHEFVPCKRNSDDVIGLYDTVEDPVTHTHQFLEPQYRVPDVGELTGSVGRFPISDYDGSDLFEDKRAEAELKSCHTRIIVAGGGGGAAVWYNQLDRRSYAGIGGGVYGGFMETFAGSTTRPYATQDSGGGFGNGQDGRDSTYNGNSAQSGASGGGGGWFGGFAMTEPGYYGYNAAGGGGSGYVLTSESWIPDDYMEDYEQYQMTRPFLGSGYAVDSCVRICEPCDAPHTGDKLIVYGFGKSQSIQVPPGEYRLKCWGACGGFTYNSTYAAPGGYAEGKLLLDTPNILYATVGGSGMYYDLGSAYQENVSGYDYVHLLRPDIGYNGGGAAIEYGQILLTADYGNGAYNGAAGGGGTDIRIGSDSLFARVIVAGGSGGSNAWSQPLKGGVGGGETGGTGQTGGNGTSPGPGTQTGTPIDPSFNVNGGFGYGGDSVRPPRTNMTAGGGGGGWYGGSSSYRNHSSGQIPPANGGSGYVFTNGSYTPPGYLLTEDFYLTDTVLNQGGSNLPIGVAKIEIDVIETKTVRILCRDSDGVKYFDPDARPTPKWVNIMPIPSELTPEVFMQYGSLMMETDNGLADEYDILVYDPDETTSKVSLNVVPNTVQIRNEITTDIDITDMKPRLEFDPADFDINITANRQSLVSGAKIKTTFDVTKKSHNDAKAKIYYVTYSDGK